MINKFKTDKDFVGYILSTYPQTRSSDVELLLAAWEIQGLHLTHAQKQLFREGKLSNAESLRRVRQKYQEQGLYPADPGVEKHRRRQEQETQQTITRFPKLSELTQSNMFEVLNGQ